MDCSKLLCNYNLFSSASWGAEESKLTFCPLNRCLECALELYPVELCLPQLARSLDTVKAAKGRTALLEVFTGNCGQAVTTAAALPALRYAALLPILV